MYSPQLMLLVRSPNAERIKERKSNMYTQDNSPFKKVRKTKEGLALKRWFKEDWRTPSGSKDYSDGDVVFRPTKKVSKDTPKTYSELSEADIKKGRRQKRKTGRAGKYGA
jgi:hypothetical protein